MRADAAVKNGVMTSKPPACPKCHGAAVPIAYGIPLRELEDGAGVGRKGMAHGGDGRAHVNFPWNLFTNRRIRLRD